MYVAGFESPKELLEFVKETARHMGELGFEESEGELLGWSTCAYTTSTEFLGELVRVCKFVLERDGSRLPQGLKGDVSRCLDVQAAIVDS
jgi:hypothetical protein